MTSARHLVLALVAMLASGPWIDAASPSAAAGCAPVDADRFRPLPALGGLPSEWAPFLALKDDRTPPRPSIAAVGPAGLCDLTRDPTAFLRLAAIDDPIDRAMLAAAARAPDVLGVPVPRFAAVVDGLVHLQTWSERDGLVIEWIIDPATLEGSFVVAQAAIGPHVSDWEGWHAHAGFQDSDLDAPIEAQATKQWRCSNADGTEWRITYFAQAYASEAEADSYAEAYCEAGQAIHAMQVGEWGFASADPDGVFDVTADGCNCIFGGDDVDIHVSPKLETLMETMGVSYPSNESFYRIVIGHEFHHHLQRSVFGSLGGDALVEGGARFAETVFAPDDAYGPDTVQYLPDINGFSRMMLEPNHRLQERSYDFGLFWGYLYSQNGGIEALKRVYEEINNVSQPVTVDGLLVSNDDRIPAAVTLALASLDGAHDSFDDAYADFAVQMLSRSFVWAKADGTDPRDWGEFLPPVTERSFVADPMNQGQAFASAISHRGIVIVNRTRDGPLLTHFAASDGGVEGWWVWTTPGGATHVQRAEATLELPVDARDKLVLVAVRGHNDDMAATDLTTQGTFAAAIESLAPPP